MSSRMFELARPHATLSIVGTAKNVGKTTALNCLIASHHAAGKRLGLTSVGRDGEDLDAITDRPKPRITPPLETLVATAATSLRRSSAGLVAVEATPWRTALGPIGIHRVTAAGSVEVAGPVTVEATEGLIARLRTLGAERILVDGALDRRASASSRVADAVILATGLAFDRDPEVVAAHTRLHARWLSLPAPTVAALPAANGVLTRSGEFVAWNEATFLEGGPGLAPWWPRDAVAIRVAGAFGDGLGRALIAMNVSDLEVVVNDGTHLVLADATYLRLEARGVRFHAARSPRLVAVTVNPTDPYGHTVDAAEFLSTMRERLDPLPVFDVEHEGMVEASRARH